MTIVAVARRRQRADNVRQQSVTLTAPASWTCAYCGTQNGLDLYCSRGRCGARRPVDEIVLT